MGGADVKRRAGAGYSTRISFGAGSWIKARAVLLGGAEVGPGNLLAAGSVVRAGVYPVSALLAGVPTRVVRHRTEEGGKET